MFRTTGELNRQLLQRMEQELYELEGELARSPITVFYERTVEYAVKQEVIQAAKQRDLPEKLVRRLLCCDFPLQEVFDFWVEDDRSFVKGVRAALHGAANYVVPDHEEDYDD